MTLVPGSRVGPYEVVSLLGEGGMGVVYRARDTRLARDVAIKVLPAAFAADADRLHRFELEAKAVGRLNHPNIMAIHDLGTTDGAPYLVMELLEGETLRERLAGRPLSPKRAVDITLQIAHGLAAAHAQGIVHRDLKPDNIFITRDGRVKILDFGLAKVTRDADPDQDTVALTLPPDPGTARGTAVGTARGTTVGTAVGTVMGTTGYMSPEQVRGEKLDGRSDLFCLGVILWEMLAGRHPFRGPSAIETMHSILKEDLPDLGADLKLPPLLDRVLHTCLAKDPAGRFHSAHDLAFALEASTLSGSTSFPSPRTRRTLRDRFRGPVLWASLGAAGALLLGGGAWAIARPGSDRPPTFQRITFAPGLVDTACFSADGRSIYFCARFQGQRPEIYVRSPESPEPRSLNAQGTVLAGLATSTELAVLREPLPYRDGFRGTLAQMPSGGGASRDLLEGVSAAAWDTAGQAFAALTVNEGHQNRLEYPPGKILHTSLGTLKLLRMSHPGDRMALVEGTGDRSNVRVFEATGASRILMSKEEDTVGATLTGLAWTPAGRDLWVSELQGDQTVLWSLSPGKRKRMVWRGPGSMQLLDIAPDGRVLLAAQRSRRGVLLQQAGQSTPRDLSILDGTQALAFLPGGGSLLLVESPAKGGGTAQDMTYLRDIAGSPAIRLGRGNPRSLSADGKWIGMNTSDIQPDGPANVFTFIPTGAGLPQAVTFPGNFEGLDDGVLFDQGRRILFAGQEKGQNWRFYVSDRQGGAPRPFTPAGIRAPRPLMLSPEGTCMIGTTTVLGEYARYPLDGSAPRPIAGLLPGEVPVAWARGGIYVTGPTPVLPVRVTRLDPATGRRQPAATFMPPDPAGYLETLSVRVAEGAGAFAYTYDRKTSDLFLVEGLR